MSLDLKFRTLRRCFNILVSWFFGYFCGSFKNKRIDHSLKLHQLEISLATYILA